ncbi:two pore domain potassium channel family protein [Vibrio parahaemolyticus]|nr:two pore domain potassium channel family protein [Vibrio parahaemolyticus]
MQARTEKKIRKLKNDAKLMLFAFAVVLLSAFPIYYFESQHPDASILTIGDALWFQFVSVTTIGFGDLTVEHTYSKWLVVLSYATSRGAFVLAVLSTGRTLLGKQKEELDQDERITIIEHEIKKMNSVLYSIDASMRRAEKKRKQEENFDKTFYASTVDSLLDLIDNNNLRRAHIHCQFELEALYHSDTEQWLNIKRVAEANKIHSISFADGQNVIFKKRHKTRSKFVCDDTPNEPF